MSDKVKHILIDLLIILAFPGALFYLYLTLRSGGAEGLLTTEEPGIELAGEGAKFIQKLEELKGLKIDTAVFTSATFQSLVDTTVIPPTDDRGRPNPFVPPTVQTQGTAALNPVITPLKKK